MCRENSGKAVWWGWGRITPRLHRSKDIEASGFNGTAAFMEVRVQSIVVEFILTHVKQLFGGPALLSECPSCHISTSVWELSQSHRKASKGL